MIVLSLAGSFFQWNADPKAYDEARARLATLILAAKQAEPNKSKKLPIGLVAGTELLEEK